MKRTLAFLISIIIILSSLAIVSHAVSEHRKGITSAQTATGSAELKFSKKFGADYKGAPTPPVVVDDTLLIISGVKLYKLDAESGEEIASVKMQSSTLYATVSPVYADGKVFVQLDGGIVQAFDYETMKSLWIYTDTLGGQAICPITYDSGYIYTGFWNDEMGNANYICLRVNDENTKEETESKNAVWTYCASGGFYWAGCAVNGGYVVFGKDDGQKGSTGESQIISLNKSSGEFVSSLTVKGDIRSAVTYCADTDAYYVSSKAGYVYKFSMNLLTGELGSLKSYTAAGAVTATPVVYGQRLYVGCQKGSKGRFIVLDANSMQEIYSCDMLGYPQASMLLSVGYEGERGKIYIYSAYNKAPGGITVFEDSAGQNEAVKNELFSPEGSMSEYCISTISAGEDGTLYYKNDSGNIFALIESIETTESFFDKIIESIRRFLQRIVDFIKELL